MPGASRGSRREITNLSVVGWSMRVERAVTKGARASIDHLGSLQMSIRRREVQEQVAQRVRDALDGRSIRWLSEQSGVPRATLAWQLKKPRLTLTTILRISPILGVQPSELLPDPDEFEDEDEGSPR